MAYCDSCGVENAANANFCTVCGTAVEKSRASADKGLNNQPLGPSVSDCKHTNLGLRTGEGRQFCNDCDSYLTESQLQSNERVEQKELKSNSPSTKSKIWIIAIIIAIFLYIIGTIMQNISDSKPLSDGWRKQCIQERQDIEGVPNATAYCEKRYPHQ